VFSFQKGFAGALRGKKWMYPHLIDALPPMSPGLQATTTEQQIIDCAWEIAPKRIYIKVIVVETFEDSRSLCGLT
jgi:hypothetical protein